MAANQSNKAEAFHKLHVPGTPIVLYNIWDAGSAHAVAAAGAKAIATSSWAVAKAHGSEDGQHFPLEAALKNLREVVNAVDLPVTFDFESGYAEEPEKVKHNVALAISAGAIGCNFEDSIPGDGSIRDTATQVPRILAVREAANKAGVPFFINARCDLFFGDPKVPHDNKLLNEVVKRAHAYAEAGASGLFVPGLATISVISELVKQTPLPVNILAGAQTSLSALADSGVARVSYGATPYRSAMDALEQAARSIAS